MERWRQRSKRWSGKRFDPPVHHESDEYPVGRHYDIKTGQWVTAEPGWWKEERARLGRAPTQPSFPAVPVLPPAPPSPPSSEPPEAACEHVVDVKQVLIEPRSRPERGYYSGYSNPGAFREFSAGIDRNKWPRTWWMLVAFFYSFDFHRDTRYVYRPPTAGTAVPEFRSPYNEDWSMYD